MIHSSIESNSHNQLSSRQDASPVEEKMCQSKTMENDTSVQPAKSLCKPLVENL